jgi:hypothetical protein
MVGRRLPLRLASARAPAYDGRGDEKRYELQPGYLPHVPSEVRHRCAVQGSTKKLNCAGGLFEPFLARRETFVSF